MIGNVEENFLTSLQREVTLTCQDSSYATMLNVLPLADVVGTSVRCIYHSVFKEFDA